MFHQQPPARGLRRIAARLQSARAGTDTGVRAVPASSWAATTCARLVAVGAFLLAVSAAHAHKGSDSYLSLTVDGARIIGQWHAALPDIDEVAGLDTNGDGDITVGEVRSRQDEIAAYAKARLQFRPDGRLAGMRVGELRIEQFPDGAFTVLPFEIETERRPATLDVAYRPFFDLDTFHRGLMQLECAGRTQSAIFSPDRTNQTFDVASPSLGRQFLNFGWEGVWHIWIGFDHILFLLALLLPSVLRRGANGWEVAPGFRPAFIAVLKIVTAFTAAHSITLSIATLGLVRLPARLVEATIAASVILAALNNLRPLFPDRAWLVAFAFGLIHGFGFANVLTELGLPAGTLAAALVGFNVGVELGQLAIVLVFLPIAFCLRGSWTYQKLTVQFGSAVIALLAATWMVERVWELKLLPF